ncbi:DUF3261 domain-containing protein [Psychromonas aquimarina]|uniref:DUF3261 domain-containing protein n=1 Tax=Psychromonas aquimarina TaxID=444919 RepID=UPI00041639A3|nr:DUF3261 domain-containing protein [Psychromonas aquimarina]
MKLKCLYFPILIMMLSACSMQPQTHPVQVEVNKDVFVTLPKPAELGERLNVSQLITAQWGHAEGNKEQKLPVQLQVDQQSVVLAGFSAWGARIISLSYSGEEIQTYVLSGLADTLPKPEQVLFNVMISIWPVESWSAPLAQIGWSLVESDFERFLLDENGQIVASVSYQAHPYIDGIIVFKHLQLNYTITIETSKSDTDK